MKTVFLYGGNYLTIKSNRNKLAAFKRWC